MTVLPVSHCPSELVAGRTSPSCATLPSTSKTSRSHPRHDAEAEPAGRVREGAAGS